MRVPLARKGVIGGKYFLLALETRNPFVCFCFVEASGVKRQWSPMMVVYRARIFLFIVGACVCVSYFWEKIHKL